MKQKNFKCCRGYGPWTPGAPVLSLVNQALWPDKIVCTANFFETENFLLCGLILLASIITIITYSFLRARNPVKVKGLIDDISLFFSTLQKEK